MKKIVIIGAGGGGLGAVRIIKDLNKEKEQWQILGYLDDNYEIQGGVYYGIKVIGTVKNNFKDPYSSYTISIAEPNIREQIKQLFDAALVNTNVTLIHPSVDVSHQIKIKEGCLIYPNVTIAPNVILNKNVMVNMGVVIGHDVEVSANSVLSPNLTLGGHVKIGKNSFLGMNCCVKQGLVIGNNCTIGAGAVVIRDVPDNAVVVGNPGRIIKYNK